MSFLNRFKKSEKKNEESFNGGQGTQWQAFLGSVSSKESMADMVMEVVKTGKKAESSKVTVDGNKAVVDYFREVSGGLGSVSIAVNNTVETAFPVIEGTHAYPCVLKVVQEWNNKVEAFLEVTGPENAMIKFFDNAYGVNHGRYEIGKTYNIQFGGLVYSISKAETGKIIEGKDGKKFSMGTGTAFLPLSFTAKDAWPNEYSVRGPVKEIRKVKGGNLLELGAYNYGKGYGEHFIITVFMSDNNNPYVPKKGDYVSAVVYLTGEIKNING